MSKQTYVYVTYIATTAEELWQALTSGEFTSRYWFGRRIESDWKVGSRVALYMKDGKLSDSGEVLEYDPPRRLSYTFHVEFDEKLRQEPASRVTFEIEPAGDAMKLTVTHSELEEGSIVLKGISQGWPKILSCLKTLLETGGSLSIASGAAGMKEAKRVIAERT